MTPKSLAHSAYIVPQRGKRYIPRSIPMSKDPPMVNRVEDLGYRGFVNHALGTNGQVACLASWGEDGLFHPDQLELNNFERNDSAESSPRELHQIWEFEASDLSRLKARSDNLNVAACAMNNISSTQTSLPARMANHAVENDLFHYGGRKEFGYGVDSSRSSFAGSQSGRPYSNLVSQAAPVSVSEEEALLEDDGFAEQPIGEFEDELMATGYSGNEDLQDLSALNYMAEDASGHYQLGDTDGPSERALDYQWDSANLIYACEEDVEPPAFPFDNESSYPHSPLAGPTYVSAMNIPPPSTHPQDNIASSWPPACSAPLDQSLAPENSVRSQNRRRGVTISTTTTAQTGGYPLPQAPLPIRNSQKRNSAKKSRSNSLTDNKAPLSLARIPIRKGGRKGKLPCSQAPLVALKRQERSVCIPCRLRRVTCPRPSKDEPCRWCSEHEQSCVPASFADISDIETFQSLSYYPSLDRSTRYRIHYNQFFDLKVLVEDLRPYHQRFEARVTSSTGAAWKLNLEICYRLLSQLATGSRSRPLRLHEVVIGKLLPGWVDCIRPTQPDVSKFERFYKYANMPSRNLYSLVPLGDSQPDRHLDIENCEDEKVIRLLIQLCRIVLRALEVVALRELQQRLNDLNRGHKSIEEVEGLVNEVARLLGSLRFRLAWWHKVESGSGSQDFILRTTELTRILYYWYFEIRKKLPESSLRKLPSGHSTTYADAGQVWEDFPITETAEDFQKWIFQAHNIITDLQRKGRLQSICTIETL